MKRIFTTLALALLVITLKAQTPEKISYQAVIRNSSNGLVVNTQIGLQVSIIQSTPSGEAVYTEIQAPTTNDNGLVSIEIGGETGFTEINWANGPYFIKTEIDITGGTNYTISGTSQLLSVPYALHAKTAENITGTITETQGLSDVVSINNSANAQIKNVTNPTDAQDAATKAYVDELKSQIEELQVLAGVKVKDIDGNIYNVVTIGTQKWFRENLKTTKLNDGTPIPEIKDYTAWNGTTSSAFCWYNNDSTNFEKTYGKLYNWYSVSTNKLCPTGWHIPTDSDWSTLETFLGGSNIAGEKMKETGTTHWGPLNINNATNESGFTALPGGIRWSAGYFADFTSYAYFWSTYTVGIDGSARAVAEHKKELEFYWIAKPWGLSARCIKD